jgi:hypothetical protein
MTRSLFRKCFEIFYMAAAVFTAGNIPLSAMDWPSKDSSMVRNFGMNEMGGPILGTFFEGDEPVLAAEQGELIFSRRKGDTAGRFPSPLGAWMALDHGDGLISIYSRYQDDKTGAVPEKAGRGAPIARSGSSGWSNKRGYDFAIFDRRERRWVNPSMIITPFPDTRPPVIHYVRLRNNFTALIDPARVRTISQGRYTVSVSASDLIDGNELPLAPHRLVCSVNGTETGSMNFETFSARDGQLMAYRNGLVPAKQVYTASGFEIGDLWFTRGQATLEIIVQDIAGNEKSAVYRLTVE